eukprot:scaffold1419_cov410-Prasinococcus_capsulatus_cf.AAC.25
MRDGRELDCQGGRGSSGGPVRWERSGQGGASGPAGGIGAPIARGRGAVRAQRAAGRGAAQRRAARPAPPAPPRLPKLLPRPRRAFPGRRGRDPRTAAARPREGRRGGGGGGGVAEPGGVHGAHARRDAGGQRASAAAARRRRNPLRRAWRRQAQPLPAAPRYAVGSLASSRVRDGRSTDPTSTCARAAIARGRRHGEGQGSGGVRAVSRCSCFH